MKSEQTTKPETKSKAKTVKNTKGVTEQPTVITKKDTKSTVAIILSCIAILSSGACGVLTFLNGQKGFSPVTFLSSGMDGNSANFVEGSIADICAMVSDSVVSIVTSGQTSSLFGNDYTSTAAGTGMIVSADGYILTNKHVVNGANKIAVVLNDGTRFDNVSVVATDPLNDVAFLKIDNVDNLKPVTLGDSKTVSIGQQVITIGNALGLYQNTVTSGIISGTGRSVYAMDNSTSTTEMLKDMIQTDAAINSGNSGGPLVNAAGEVIGINTATSQVAENVGFAIPISSIKGMLSNLISTGRATRAYLGVYQVEITPEIAQKNNLPVSKGAWIRNSSSSFSAIINGSAASRAGLKDGDIVVAVNGAKVGEAGSLSNLIGEYKPDDTVQLTVIRDGQEGVIDVTLDGYSK